jgi:hypothetical protein
MFRHGRIYLWRGCKTRFHIVNFIRLICISLSNNEIYSYNFDTRVDLTSLYMLTSYGDLILNFFLTFY